MNAPPLLEGSHFAAQIGILPDFVALLDLAPPKPQAVLIDEDPFKAEAVVEALYTAMPDGELLERLAGRPVHVSLLPDSDWIKLSQEGLAAGARGRFFVYGAHDAGEVPDGVIPMRIEAGLAFGTGHHETTALCLAALSDLAKRPPSATCWTWAAAPACSRSARRSCGANACSPPTSIRSPSR